jgi:predicted LPLAT superfamily acyltransferase
MKTCILIPNYNHGRTIDALLLQLELYKLPCIMVDDGSDLNTKTHLAAAAQKFDWLSIHTLATNGGKGAAMIAGFTVAAKQGFTHAIQIDADGQHDTNDMPAFIKAIKAHPDTLILGMPEYDSSAPKSRLYGRRITNFWVRIETLSFQIQDSMCGFRAYPLAQTLEVIHNNRMGKRMDFDTDIVVKLYWAGIEVVPIKTKVIYLPDTPSHFRLFADNAKISWMHTTLVFGMVRHIPALLKRHRTSEKPWFAIPEKGSLWGLKLMLFAYKLMGLRVAKLLLYPVIAYFYCFSPRAREASQAFLKRADCTQHSFKHFLSFGQAALDKMAVWNGDITIDQIDFPNTEILYKHIKNKQGAVMLTGHMGNIEIARALSRFHPGVKINALVFSAHAQKFNQVLTQVNPDCQLNVIQVTDTNIELAIALKDKIDQGEFVVIVGDRVSVTNPGRLTAATFLGHTAHFPQGPFILAGLMHCPVYSLFCFKQSSTRFVLHLEPLATSIKIQGKHRHAELEKHTQCYADILARHTAHYPLQWFNFFNFWRTYRKDSK